MGSGVTVGQGVNVGDAVKVGSGVAVGCTVGVGEDVKVGCSATAVAGIISSANPGDKAGVLGTTANRLACASSMRGATKRKLPTVRITTIVIAMLNKARPSGVRMLFMLHDTF